MHWLLRWWLKLSNIPTLHDRPKTLFWKITFLLLQPRVLLEGEVDYYSVLIVAYNSKESKILY